MSKKSLFAEAMADAKDLKAVAFANAKAALEETFTPKLKSMINAKLNEDLDEEDSYEEDDEKDANSDVDEAKKKKPEEGDDKPEEDGENIDLEELLRELEDDGDSEDKPEEDSEVDETYDAEEKDGEKDVKPMDEKKKKPSEDEEGDEEEKDEMDEHAQYLKLKEKFEKKAPKEEKPEESEEEKDDSDTDEDIDVEALLKELEGGDEEDANHEDEVDEAFGDKEEAGKKNVKPMDEEDGAVKSLADKLKAGAVGVIDDFKKDYEALKDSKTRAEWLQSLATTLGRSQGVAEIKKLTAEMNEVNLLNAKYLFFIKTINENTSFKQEDKVRVLKQFDKCNTVKEIKLVYRTISESFKTSVKKGTKKSIKENLGFASKATGTAKKTLKENEDIVDPGVARWQFLAGIHK